MESNKFFSKLNIKDYNNELEKILDNKLFSVDVKNILLSMFYKIENAYKDYLVVKREVISKKDFIKYLLKVIKEKCLEIEFIKIDNDNIKENNFDISIDKKQGKIKCYPNESSLLSAICYIDEVDFEFKSIYDYTKDSIKEMISIGDNMNKVEIIRDFNGFSWDVVKKHIESIPYNIIYQSLLLYYGKEVNNINISKGNEEKFNLVTEIFEKIDDKEDKLQTSLYEVCMSIYLSRNKEKIDDIENVIKVKKEELELFQNKKEFIQKATDNKKIYNEQIEKIDKLVNNTTLLKEEYNKRNENLPNKEKIFSISHLVDRLEKERNQFLEKLKECNKMIGPKEFVKQKGKVEKEIEFLNSFIDIENLKDIKLEECIIKYCNEYLKKVEKLVQKIEEKEEIVNWIYKIRYFALLPYIDGEISLIDVKKLKENFKKIIKQIIKKAQSLKVFDTFSDTEDLTYNVLKELFEIRLINLENLNIICKYKEGILSVQYYDGEILEKAFEVKMDNAKIKKKIKLFI